MNFLKGILGKLIGLPWWAYAIGVALLMGASFYSGWQVRAWKCDATQVKVVEKQVQKQEENTAIVHEEAVKYQKEIVYVEKKHAERKQAIQTIYKTVVVSPDCAAPEPVRSLLEQSVSDVNAQIRGDIERTLSGFTVPTYPIDRSGSG